MASKGGGTIREALEKARARRLDVLKPKRGGSSERRSAIDVQEAIRQIPTFPTATYDPATCRRNRVLAWDTRDTGKTAGAAAYRMLRARLLQRTRANQWQRIGVTSPGAGEGKSLTCINLALTVARERNNNVFLIDLDMRTPKMCQYLGTTPPTEIDEFLRGRARAQDCLFSIGIENLILAGTRTPTDHSSELLASGRLEELFEYIRGVAPEPFIIVDLPPLLSTDDALVVAPKVDACLLVVCEGKSRRDGAAKALQLLSEFNFAGIVFNKSRAVIPDYYST